MKCNVCQQTAHRQGTKGRYYCFKHESHAFDQIRDESRRNSMRQEIISEEVQRAWRQERAFRAV